MIEMSRIAHASESGENSRSVVSCVEHSKMMPATGISVPRPQVIASRVPTPGAMVRSNSPSLKAWAATGRKNALTEHVGEPEGRGRGHADRHDHGDRESGHLGDGQEHEDDAAQNPQHQVDDGPGEAARAVPPSARTSWVDPRAAASE